LQNGSSIGEYMEAHMHFACSESLPAEFSFMLQMQRSPSATPKPPVLYSGAYLEDASVSPGSYLADGVDVRQSVLGPWTYVGSGARLCRVVTHGCTKPQGHLNYDHELEEKGHARGIGAGTVLKNVIVGYNASIGKNVNLVNEQGLRTFDAWENGFAVRDGVIVVLKGASIPDNFKF
jgi:glucose-1-phosphate adenylyltransferase